MEKVLGQHIEDIEQRKQFLLDNCDKVVEMNYHKSFTSDELAEKKNSFVDKSIRIASLEEKIKELKDEINIELKPLKEEVDVLRDELKSKGQLVYEKVYQFLDEQEKMVCFYNNEGVLVSSRPATREELQKTVFAEMRKEGTND